MIVRGTRWVLPLAFTALAALVGGTSPGRAADDAAQSPLVVRVTTDRHVYRLRRPVRITLTETNTSDHEVAVAIGCQILHGSITRDGETVWTFHDYTLCATGEEMLQAGTSRTLGLFWNGRPNPGVELEPGVSVVHAMDRLGTFTRLSHAQCLLHIVHAAGHGREGERPHPASP